MKKQTDDQTKSMVSSVCVCVQVIDDLEPTHKKALVNLWNKMQTDF